MKHIAFFFAWIFCVSFVNAQGKFKFGEVPDDLVKMTVYDKDSTASAFVVYENQNVYYSFNTIYSDFELVYDYTVRIKILTTDGVEQANVSIPFYKGINSASSETISSITGWTYNLENGKTVKEKLSKDYVFTESVTDNYKRIKFALPAVKAGSVIEYKYSRNSPFYYNPQTFRFQRSIPVKYSHFTISIPEFFVFNRETRGFEPIKIGLENTDFNFNINGKTQHFLGEKISAEASDLPALKDESYVWNYNDFMTSISFGLKRVEISGVYYKDYAQTWDKVAEGLIEYENFGGKLKDKGLFKDELAALKTSEGSDEEKLRAILNIVRGKVKWNERNTLYINNPAKALKEGAGSSGEINALLFNAVRNAGYDVAAVVMSLRSNGRIPLTYPGRDYFNYFIVQVKIGEKTYYLDATRSYCDVNVIPVDCLVDKALCIMNDKSFSWVDLTKTGNNTSRVNLFVYFNEEGALTGKKTGILTGENISSFKQAYEQSKDEAEYIRKVETDNDISVIDYKVDTKQTFLTESYNFTSNSIRIGGENILTIQPLLFETMRKNPFKQENRKLPVEFNFPQEERINVVFTFPKGYALDEAPKSVRFVYGDDSSIEFGYIVQVNNNSLQISYRFKLNTGIVPAEQYEGLRDFISKMFAKCQEVIVFKKI